MIHKKVLLRERKRHTACRVASANYVALIVGVPHPVLVGGYPPPTIQTWDGYPPVQTWDGVHPLSDREGHGHKAVVYKSHFPTTKALHSHSVVTETPADTLAYKPRLLQRPSSLFFMPHNMVAARIKH